MTTDRPDRLLQPRPSIAPIGSRRIEATLTSMASGFGLLFALLTITRLVHDWNQQRIPVVLAIAVAVYGMLALSLLSALLRVWTRGVFWLCGVVYLISLLASPLAIDGRYIGVEQPWLMQLAGVPIALVVVAARRWQPAVAAVLIVAGVIVALRTTPSGGAVVDEVALVDGAFVAELGIAIVILVAAVRRAARDVDRAQGAALSSYADAQIDEATESERVRTDALVHDSVLTTFLSASGAQTPEARALAARMATNAMNVLSRATVASHVGPKVAVSGLPNRIRAESAGIGERFEITMRDVRDHFVPEQVADAIVSAAVQAMTNSVKHAGGPDVRRVLTVQGTATGGVRVNVEDDGRGFDPGKIASERLGLRVSILERMRRVGGEVDLRTAIGAGTTFVLSWPAAEPNAPRRVRDDEAVLI